MALMTVFMSCIPGENIKSNHLDFFELNHTWKIPVEYTIGRFILAAFSSKIKLLASPDPILRNGTLRLTRKSTETYHNIHLKYESNTS